MQSIGAAHQFRMSPFRLAHMDSPAVVSPHCVGYRDEHWMPHVAFVHTRVPLQSCSEFCGKLAEGTPQDWIPSAGKQLSAYARQTACQEQALTSAPAMLQLGVVGSPWVPSAALRAVRHRCRTCCSCQRGRSCCRTRRSLGCCLGWRRTCRCWSCTPSDRLPSTAPCNSLQAATRMLAGVGWQVSLLLGTGISAIPFK